MKTRELYKYVKESTDKGKLPKPLKTLAQTREFMFKFNEVQQLGCTTVVAKEVAELFGIYSCSVIEQKGFYMIYAQEGLK